LARAQAVLNCRSRDILAQSGNGPMFLQSEDTSAWPEYLKKQMERGDMAQKDDEKEVYQITAI
jgi:hypothetical protein